MNRAFSHYLDVLRFGAAFVVLLSHFGYQRFSEGRYEWVRELNLGSDAVVLFFVLSGIVIAFAAQTKDATLGQFTFNRLTRILSVALPALVVGYMLDCNGAALFPAFYDGPYYNPLPFTEQLLRGLSFSNEWAGQETRLGSNGPYWSLSYEVAYYLLFAVAWYMTGVTRAALLALSVLVIGVNVLLLMPSWLLGVWVWRRLEAGRLPQARLARAMLILPPLAYALALFVGLPDALSALTFDMMAGHTTHLLRFSDEFVWNALLGIGFALHLLGAAAMITRAPKPTHARAVKWLAGGSFSLYLVHYPLLQFLRPALPQSGFALVDDLTLLGLTFAFCLIFAQVFERTLKEQRALWRLLPFQTKKATSI